MSRLKTLIGLAVAVGALAVVAAPAMAFTNFEGNGKEITSSGGTQTFTVTGGSVTCKKVSGTSAAFTGTKTEVPTKTITFSECEVPGIGKATVTCSGFTFHIAGTVDVTGAGCEITAVTCKIKVAAQTGLKSDGLVVLASFETEQKNTVAGITYTISGFCPGITAGSTGKYVGNFISKNLTVN
jgi:hypothetical protein